MPLSRRLSVASLTLALVVASGLVLGARQAAAPVQAPPVVDAMVASARTSPLDTKIPTDPAILTGEFPNGLKYYVRRNGKPENRAELRLVVNAGSVLEDNDQQGLAHFVEHMAFNGTKNFPKLDIVKFMESIGMRFGPSVNAFTSFDETVYQLQVPTEKIEIVDRALLILEDWAQNVTFDPEEIDKERGVIIEEWRSRRGAAARIQDRQLPVLLARSQYATRLPIGTVESLQGFTHNRLIQYYRDWYRPDLMAVIAVGDFDPKAIVSLVEKRFGAIPRRTTPRPRPVHTVPARTTPAFVVATDREQSLTQVSVANIAAARDESTVGSYRQSIVEGLFASMLSARFLEISQKPDAPFLGAAASRGSFVRTAEASQLGAIVKEDGLERGLEALFVEAERVAKFGFTATELDRSKRETSRGLERAVAEKDNQQSANLAAEYSRNYLEAEPIPGILYEQALYERFLPTITLAELNALARTWSPDASRVVMVTAPEKAGLTPPTEARLGEIIKTAAGRATTPYDDGSTVAPLFAKTVTPGRIVNTSAREGVGITEWTLSNGVKVVLKPTTFKQDEIVFRAFSEGGTSLAADADYTAASFASTVVAAGGLGALNAADLRKALTGVAASATPTIGAYEEGLAGGGSPKDLESLFQQIHLRFTDPRPDAEIFGVIREQLRAQLTNQAATPGFAFQEAMASALWQDHPRARVMTLARVDEMNLDKSLAFYRDRFADAGDFTFVFVGTFDLAVMRPLVEKYLATLPSTGRKETWKDVGLRYPTSVVTRLVEKGIEPRSQMQVVFSGAFQNNQTNRTVARAMTTVLSTRLRNALREDLGGTYSVSAAPNFVRIPRQEFSVAISFGSSPDRAEALFTQVLSVIEAFKKEGPTPQELEDAKQALKREFETSRTSNAYLLTNIAGRYQSSESVEEFFAIDKTFDGLTATAIQDAARTYLPADRYVRVTLMPERR